MAHNFLTTPPPNKRRGSKIKVHDKDVIQAQKQERSTQNLRKTQSRKGEIRPEQEPGANGSTRNAQADSQEITGTPGNAGNVVNGRHIYKTRNGLMSYGLKRGKKTDASSLPRPTTSPRLAKPSQPSPKKSPVVKSRARGSPKKESQTIVRKRRKSGADSEEEC